MIAKHAVVLAGLAITASTIQSITSAIAQTYPSRLITIKVPHAAGPQYPNKRMHLVSPGVRSCGP